MDSVMIAIGVSMIAAFFIGLFVMVATQEGLGFAAKIFGTALAMSGFLFVAAWLIGQGVAG